MTTLPSFLFFFSNIDTILQTTVKRYRNVNHVTGTLLCEKSVRKVLDAGWVDGQRYRHRDRKTGMQTN